MKVELITADSTGGSFRLTAENDSDKSALRSLVEWKLVEKGVGINAPNAIIAMAEIRVARVETPKLFDTASKVISLAGK